jgi:multicomponent Na+:H+ antiporter subunit A
VNHRSVIFDTTVRVVFDAAIVLSLYLLRRPQPAGWRVRGWTGRAAALALRYSPVASTSAPLLRSGPGRCCRPGSPWPRARPSGRSSPVTPLDHEAYGLHPALLGDVKVTTAAVFDGGVYLIVVGLLLMVLEALGEGVGEGVGTGDEEERS